ncbi:MAG: F0F1 ATP synthase subunit A [Dehalococcoidales bacterium]
MAKRRVLGMPRLLLVGILCLFVLLLIVGFLVGPLGRSVVGDLGLPAWLSLPHPEFKLPAETAFHLFGFPIANSIIGAWITMVFLICLSYVITRRMKIVPGRLQSAFEALLGWLYDLCRRVAGEKNGRRFFPVVTTIFLFVAFNAWLSLIPGFGSIFVTNAEGEQVHLLRGANTDINMPLALALISFVFVEYFGLKSLGLRYLGKFLNVGQFFESIRQMAKGRLKAGLGGLFTGFIHIFVGLLETLSELVRVVSFTFRLFGNMTAGEILLLIAAFLIPWVFALPFYGLELLVGFVQALIFGGLTLVFLTLAVTHHGEEST